MAKAPVLLDPVKKAPPSRLKAQNVADSGNPVKGAAKPRGAGRNPFLELTRTGGKL